LKAFPIAVSLAQPVTRQIVMADPVRPQQVCEVRIGVAGVSLRRSVDGVKMNLGCALSEYRGVVAYESEAGYALKLVCRNAAFNVILGAFSSLEQLGENWADWGRFTGLPLLVETEVGSLRPLSRLRVAARRYGMYATLAGRRGRFSRRRRMGVAARTEVSFKGAREIINRN